MRGAAIDLGSNSFICYVFEVNDGQLITLDDQIVLTRLSEGVDKTHTLAPSALERSELAFQKFRMMFKRYGVTQVQAVATSAARDAENQKEFLDLASKYEIPVRIISGVEEASLTFDGVKENFNQDDGLIIDIGGGSTEFVLVKDGQMQDRLSLDVGVVRFTERFLKDKDFRTEEFALRSAIQSELQSNSKLKDFKNHKLDVFLAVSGTPTAAAAVLQMGFDSVRIDQFQLNSEGLAKVVRDYAYLDLDERLKKYPFVELKRADVLPTGVLILDEALKFFDFQAGYKISTRGIRHGLARFMSNGVSEL